jgi:hypothetical protein
MQCIVCTLTLLIKDEESSMELNMLNLEILFECGLFHIQAVAIPDG